MLRRSLLNKLAQLEGSCLHLTRRTAVHNLQLQRALRTTSVQSFHLNPVSNFDHHIKPDFKITDAKRYKLSYATSISPNKLHKVIDTVGDRLRAMAQEHPDQVCYKFPFLNNLSLTYGQLYYKVEKYAQALLEMGFKKGDRLAVMLPNTPELIFSMFAAASIGVITVLLNPAYQLVEIEYMLKKTGAKGIVMLDELRVLKHMEVLKKICPELESCEKGELNSKALPNLKHVVVVDIMRTKKQHKGTWAFGEIENLPTKVHEKPKTCMDDPMAMLFTSGTTGLPKGAVLSHFNLLNAAQMESFEGGCRKWNDVVCCPIPIFHIFGIVVGLLNPLLIGNSTVFPFFFPDTMQTMRAIQSEKCTSIKGPPVIFIDMLNHPERKKFDLSSLKLMLLSAATVPVDLCLRMKSEFNLADLLIAYAMTESAAAGTGTVTQDKCISDKIAYGSIGRVIPYSEVKIVDPKTRELVPRNVDGEICFRGFNVMKCYWDEPEKTAEVIDKNGWLHTGDIGCMDENDYLYFKSRSKEVIIRGGVNIYPAEVEGFLRTIPGVFDVYVFGVPNEKYGEEVCAWFKLKPDCKLTVEEINEYCKDKIAFFKVPKIIKFVENFPVNATGKVQKFKMVQMMKEETKL